MSKPMTIDVLSGPLTAEVFEIFKSRCSAFVQANFPDQELFVDSQCEVGKLHCQFNVKREGTDKVKELTTAYLASLQRRERFWQSFHWHYEVEDIGEDDIVTLHLNLMGPSLTEEKAYDFLVRNFKQELVMLAQKALLFELTTSPKPGLVDRMNTGSHTDMDFQLFVESILYLRPYFARLVDLGHDAAVVTMGKLMDSPLAPAIYTRWRELGLAFEEGLMEQTHGINTYKGVIYTFGLFIFTKAFMETKRLRQKNPVQCEYMYFKEDVKEEDFFRVKVDPDVLELMNDKEFKRSILDKDLTPAFEMVAFLGSLTLLDLKNPDTPAGHGLKLAREEKIPGLRHEAAEGYPILRNIAYPTYRNSLKYFDGNENLAGLYTLYLVIPELSDTNLYHRLGYHEGQLLQRQFGQAFQDELNRFKGKIPAHALVRFGHQWDSKFIRANASPGGAADILGLAYLYYGMQNL